MSYHRIGCCGHVCCEYCAHDCGYTGLATIAIAGVVGMDGCICCPTAGRSDFSVQDMSGTTPFNGTWVIDTAGYIIGCQASQEWNESPTYGDPFLWRLRLFTSANCGQGRPWSCHDQIVGVNAYRATLSIGKIDLTTVGIEVRVHDDRVLNYSFTYRIFYGTAELPSGRCAQDFVVTNAMAIGEYDPCNATHQTEGWVAEGGTATVTFA